MKHTEFVTVLTVGTSSEASRAVDRLRHAGLHPAEVSLSAMLPMTGSTQTFPVKVPPNEIVAARDVLKPSARA